MFFLGRADALAELVCRSPHILLKRRFYHSCGTLPTSFDDMMRACNRCR